MTCRRCGRWAPADAETGYDADDFCPDCLRIVEDEQSGDEHERDEAYERAAARDLADGFARIGGKDWT